MALAWFICQYKIKTGNWRPVRYCAMDDFTAQINADGGSWAESEVLGGYALVKVRANTTTLTTIGGTTNFQRIPNWVNLSDILSTLTTAQRTAIQNRILAMGYTQAEINAVMGNNLTAWRTRTLRQLLNFIAQRRLKPRWDSETQQIVLDGVLVACKPIASVDAEVQ
jgi:hypothetical protein